MIKFICILGIITSSIALENPLTFNTALQLTYANNVEIKHAMLDIQSAQQDIQGLLEDQDLQSSINLNFSRKERYDDHINNSVGYLLFKKNIYSQQYTIDNTVKNWTLYTKKSQLDILKKQQSIKVLQGFFDVVLTELYHQYAIENLAVAAVAENHTKDDFEIGETSDVQVLETHTNSQLALVELRKAQADMRLSVANLSLLLGLKFDEIDRVILPNIQQLVDKKLPEVEEFLAKLNNNTTIQLLQLNLQQLQQHISLENNNYNITVDGYTKFHKYAFDTDKNGQWVAGIELNIPLGESANVVQKLLIQKQQLENQIQQHTQQVTYDILDIYLQLKNLKQQQTALQSQLEYRDFYLEKARATYELELKSDIGDAMAQYTKTEYLIAKNKFDIVIAWHTLALLIGENYEH
jgi:outer membrane protein TolC